MRDLVFLVPIAAKFGLEFVEVMFDRLFAAGVCFFFLPEVQDCIEACDVVEVPEVVDVASSSLFPIITAEA